MIKLLLPSDVALQLFDALQRAGAREIGGVLMGEHVGFNTFRIVEITVQMKGGTFASFVRRVGELMGPLLAFFERTKHDYVRFNYLGEWHSHHAFALKASGPDVAAMREILRDRAVGATFAVLMLVRIDSGQSLQCAATVYEASGASVLAEIVGEG